MVDWEWGEGTTKGFCTSPFAWVRIKEGGVGNKWEKEVKGRSRRVKAKFCETTRRTHKDSTEKIQNREGLPLFGKGYHVLIHWVAVETAPLCRSGRVRDREAGGGG